MYRKKFEEPDVSEGCEIIKIENTLNIETILQLENSFDNDQINLEDYISKFLYLKKSEIVFLKRK